MDAPWPIPPPAPPRPFISTRSSPSATTPKSSKPEAPKTAWQKLKGRVNALPADHPRKALLVKAGLFYADFVSDVLYARLLWENDLVGLFKAVIVVLVLPPVALSAMDLHEYYNAEEGSQRDAQMGWFGVLLNLTNTRMLYTLLLSQGSTREDDSSCLPAWCPAALLRTVDGQRTSAKVAEQAGSNIKLFEAMFEAMPQLYIQVRSSHRTTVGSLAAHSRPRLAMKRPSAPALFKQPMCAGARCSPPPTDHCARPPSTAIAAGGRAAPRAG